jgi:hypothetical protein
MSVNSLPKLCCSRSLYDGPVELRDSTRTSHGCRPLASSGSPSAQIRVENVSFRGLPPFVDTVSHGPDLIPRNELNGDIPRSGLWANGERTTDQQTRSSAPHGLPSDLNARDRLRGMHLQQSSSPHDARLPASRWRGKAPRRLINCLCRFWSQSMSATTQEAEQKTPAHHSCACLTRTPPASAHPQARFPASALQHDGWFYFRILPTEMRRRHIAT